MARRSQGKLEEAIELFEKTMKIDLKVYGPDHPYVADDGATLAELRARLAQVCSSRNPCLQRSITNTFVTNGFDVN